MLSDYICILILSFRVAGEIRYGRNGVPVSTLMHVDTTLPMWAFFDIYGNTQKIKILGKHTDGSIFLLIKSNAEKLGVMFYHARYLCLYVKKLWGVG